MLFEIMLPPRAPRLTCARYSSAYPSCMPLWECTCLASGLPFEPSVRYPCADLTPSVNCPRCPQYMTLLCRSCCAGLPSPQAKITPMPPGLLPGAVLWGQPSKSWGYMYCCFRFPCNPINCNKVVGKVTKVFVPNLTKTLDTCGVWCLAKTKP